MEEAQSEEDEDEEDLYSDGQNSDHENIILARNQQKKKPVRSPTKNVESPTLDPKKKLSMQQKK